MNRELIEKDHLYLYAHKDLVDEAREMSKNLFDRNMFDTHVRLANAAVKNDETPDYTYLKDSIENSIAFAWIYGCKYAVQNEIGSTAPVHDDQKSEYRKNKDFAFMYYFGDNDFGLDFEHAARLYCEKYNDTLHQIDCYDDNAHMADFYKKNLEQLENPDNIITILKSGILSKEFEHSFYHNIHTFDEIVADIKHTYDYLDINLDKTRNLYNYENDNYEFSGTISNFKCGTFDEVKEHALRMEQGNYTWDNLWQNGECLYVFIENGEMKYRVR
jgi:hypothetical protein